MEIYHHSNYGSIFEQNCRSIPVLKPIDQKHVLPVDHREYIDLSEPPIHDLEEEKD